MNHESDLSSFELPDQDEHDDEPIKIDKGDITNDIDDSIKETRTLSPQMNRISTSHKKNRYQMKQKVINSNKKRTIHSRNSQSSTRLRLNEPNILHNKHNPLNPILPMNPFTQMSLEDTKLEEDLYLIRGCETKDNCRVMRISLRLSNDSPDSEDQVSIQITFNKSHLNDDWCAVCLQPGQFLCCESCPLVFHPSCTQQGYHWTSLPSGKWDCDSCVHKRSTANNKKLKLSLSKPNLFSQLISNLCNDNPKVFSLPLSIRSMFPDIWLHPRTGQYVHKQYNLIAPLFKPRSLRIKQIPSIEIPIYSKKSSKQTNLINNNISTLSKTTKDGVSFLGTQDPTSTTKKPNSKKKELSSKRNEPVSPTKQTCPATKGKSFMNEPSSSMKSHQFLCFKCGLSTKSSSTLLFTYINESSISAPSNKQASSSPLIKCDYCINHWHLDCLDPPLSTLPNAFRTDATEFIQIAQLHPSLKKSLYLLGYIEESETKAGVIGYSSRPKWACPLHSDIVSQIDVNLSNRVNNQTNFICSNETSKPDIDSDIQTVVSNKPSCESEIQTIQSNLLSTKSILESNIQSRSQPCSPKSIKLNNPNEIMTESIPNNDLKSLQSNFEDNIETTFINKFKKTPKGLDWNPDFLNMNVPVGIGRIFRSNIMDLYTPEINHQIQATKLLVASEWIENGGAECDTRQDYEAMNFVSGVLDMQNDLVERLLIRRRINKERIGSREST